VIAGVEQMRGRDGETADLQYFYPQDMPVLSMKYPIELLVDGELPHVHFDWNESYLNLIGMNHISMDWYDGVGCLKVSKPFLEQTKDTIY
jgi:hypothetical protein